MKSAAKFFNAKGPIASAMQRYEPRKEQVQMARAVEETIERGGVLLAEAGTGTGKTLAYLVPAVLSDLRVVVSTGTKNLQEQVYFKEIDFLSRALDMPISAVYLKGQDNYLCLRRLSEFLTSPKVLAYSAKKVAALEDWSLRTASGDRMEIEGLPDDDPLWRELCSTRDTRIGAKCPFNEECFVTRARLAAMRAKVVVVNHHLYFADLATRVKGGAILPDHDVVIFDEAHAIEDVATEFFSTQISSSRVDRTLNDVLGAVRRAKLQDDPAQGRRQKYVESARSASIDLFARFRGPEGRVTLTIEEIGEERRQAYFQLDSALDAVFQSLKQIEGKDEAVNHALGRVETLRSDLDEVIAQTGKGMVYWLENQKRSVKLGASPIDVSGIIRQGVFFSIPAVVLTSATLSTSGDFKFLKSRLGLDFDVTELSLPSPFDFQKQARIYLPGHLPDPRDPNFVDKVAAESARLIDLSGGGALILFTSIHNMNETHRLLKERGVEPLLLQGEAPKSKLLGRFVENPCSVLCATASFWQGVDIPGDALRLVIIDKLPFDSPSDPLVAARIDYLRENGGRPFIDYQVPQAALALKQGFGRLIRTKYDFGLVAVLDRRLRTMQYASHFLKSLPDCPVLASFEEVEAWWRALNSGHRQDNHT